jgi:integrase
LPVEELDVTLRDYARRWLATVAIDKSPQTHRSYEERLERHVLPALGHLKLRALQRAHIKLFLAEKRRQGHGKNSVRLMRAALSSMLSDAADDGLIPTNPALHLGRRRAGRADALTPAERQQRIRPMSIEERDAFLKEIAREPRYSGLFATLAYAGLRPGEGFALKPGDLDFRNRLIRIERALSLGTIKDTKTHETRDVDMSRDLSRLLQGHLAWLKAESLPRGWGTPEWLFPNEVGRPLDEAKAGRVFRSALHRARLPAFRVYDLRHTFTQPIPRTPDVDSAGAVDLQGDGTGQALLRGDLASRHYDRRSPPHRLPTPPSQRVGTDPIPLRPLSHRQIGLREPEIDAPFVGHGIDEVCVVHVGLDQHWSLVRVQHFRSVRTARELSIEVRARREQVAVQIEDRERSPARSIALLPRVNTGHRGGPTTRGPRCASRHHPAGRAASTRSSPSQRTS